MSPVQNVWRQLVQRRLLPVAVLLLAALVAIPLILANQPEPAAAPAVAPLSGEDALATQPIVALADADDRSKRRHVLGTAKNPFALPEPVVAPPAAESGATIVAPSTAEPAPLAPSSLGSSSPGGSYSPAPATPVPQGDSVGETYTMHEPTVRFGEVSGDPARATLRRLQPVPSADVPVLLNLGVLKDGKTAVFLLGRGVSAAGDGECEPTPEQCYTTRLKAGQTDVITVTDEAGAVVAQFRLELIKIRKRTTTTSALANARSKAGLRLIRARVVTGGPTGYRWNPEIIALERRSARSLQAELAARSVSLLP